MTSNGNLRKGAILHGSLVMVTGEKGLSLMGHGHGNLRQGAIPHGSLVWSPWSN